MNKEISVRQILLSCCLVLGTFFLFFGGPNPTSSPLYPAVWNLGHILYFAILAILSRQLIAPLRDNPDRFKFFVFTIVVLFLGLVIEWAQSGLSRDQDWHDIGRNQLGAWFGWVLLNERKRGMNLAFSLLLFSIVGELCLVGNVAWNDHNYQNQVPLLSALETENDLKRWTGDVSLSGEIAAYGQSSMKVDLTTDLYSGTGSTELPRDWRGYEKLVFEIYNPGPESLRLTCNLADTIHELEGYKYSDRFTRSLLINVGWSHQEIRLEEVRLAPQNREMDLENMYRVVLFASNLKQPKVIYLDYFRLE